MILSAPFFIAAYAVGMPVTIRSSSDDWRSELPQEAQKAVAKVDAQKKIQAVALIYEDDDHKKDVEGDIEIGRKYAEQIDKELKASENEELIAKVNLIGGALAKIANESRAEVSWGDERLSPLPYEFHIVEGEEVNAFSIPGGILYVYEGLVDFAQSDDELAGVLAHEISHAAFRHVAYLQQRQQKLSLYQLPLLLAAVLSGGRDAGAIANAASLSGTAMLSGWSVDAETAADYGAVQYLLQSNYNPAGALTLMERLAIRAANLPNIDWGIARTHPQSTQRTRFMMNRLSEYGVEVKRSEVTTTFRAVSVIGEDGLDLKFGDHLIHTFRGTDAISRSEDAVIKLNTFFDKEPSTDEVGRYKYKVRGMNRTIFEVIQEDMLPGGSMDDEMAGVMKRLRAAAYDMKYKLWTARRAG